MALVEPGALLNEDRPSLQEGEEYLSKYNDTPELAYLDEILPIDAAICALRPELARAGALQEICIGATHIGVIPRDLVRTYIARMTGPPRRSLAESAFESFIVPIAEGRRGRGSAYIAQAATALVKSYGPFQRFSMRRRWTYVKWESYGKVDECYYRNGDICIVAEPFCILPCGLLYCYNGRADTVFLLDYESGRAVEVDYGDAPYPFSSEHWPKGYMVDDYGKEYNVPRRFVGHAPQHRIV